MLAVWSGTLTKLNFLSLFINMKTFRVQFLDDISAETEEEAYAILLESLASMAQYQDATAFQFEEVEHKTYQTH